MWCDMNESDPRSDVHYLGSSENKAWKKKNSVPYRPEIFFSRALEVYHFNVKESLGVGGLPKWVFLKVESALPAWGSGGFTINALDSRSRGPDSRRSLVIVLCSWVRHFTQTVPLPLYPAV